MTVEFVPSQNSGGPYLRCRLAWPPPRYIIGAAVQNIFEEKRIAGPNGRRLRMFGPHKLWTSILDSVTGVADDDFRKLNGPRSRERRIINQ
jgi:hypothetical protein